jgi:hypothetical protein
VPLNIEIVDLASFLALSVAQKQRVVQNLQQLSRQGTLSGWMTLMTS